MIKDKYLKQIHETVDRFSRGRDVKFFIYGSSLVKDRFGDVDIGVEGDVQGVNLGVLREAFEESTLPYFVDVVDFNGVSEEFRNNVKRQETLWLTPSRSN